MKGHVLNNLFLSHGIFDDVAGRGQIGCTPPCLVIEHFSRICCSARGVQVECKKELADQNRKLAPSDASRVLDGLYRLASSSLSLPREAMPLTERSTILAFKAGRAFRRDGTNVVEPSPDKGAVVIERGEDEELHFMWKNRETEATEEVSSSQLDSISTDCAPGPHLIPARC